MRIHDAKPIPDRHLRRNALAALSLVVSAHAAAGTARAQEPVAPTRGGTRPAVTAPAVTAPALPRPSGAPIKPGRPCPTPPANSDATGSLVTGARQSRWIRRAHSPTVVVFVHGFNSNGSSAFLCRFERVDGTTDTTYFPEVVARSIPFGRDTADVAVLEWWTGIFTGTYNLQDAATHLYDEVAGGWGTALDAPIGSSTTNLVFVTHSTGGLIVTRMLGQHPEAFRHLNVGLFLIASPGKGAFTAVTGSDAYKAVGKDFTNLLVKFLNVAQPQQLIDQNSAFLRGANDDFVAHWRPTVRGRRPANPDGRTPAAIREVCESQGLLEKKSALVRLIRPLGEASTVVPRMSCTNFTTEADTIVVPDADHFEVAKPATDSAPTAILFRRFAREVDSTWRSRTLVVNALVRADARITKRSAHEVFVAQQCLDINNLTFDARGLTGPLAYDRPTSAVVRDPQAANDLDFETAFVVSSTNPSIRVIVRPRATAQVQPCVPIGKIDPTGIVIPDLSVTYYSEATEIWRDTTRSAFAVESRLSARQDVSLSMPCPAAPADADPLTVECHAWITLDGQTFDGSPPPRQQINWDAPAPAGFGLFCPGRGSSCTFTLQRVAPR